MRSHLSNATYSVLDYIAMPAGMLVAVPVLLHHLGASAYGVWLIASAAVSAGSIVSSSFGDAVIQRIASLRSTGDVGSIRGVLATTLAINLVLCSTLAAILWSVAGLAVPHIAHGDASLAATSVRALRIGALLIVLKSFESVYMSAHRAFQAYGPAVGVSIATRLLSVVFAVALVTLGHGVIAMMLATFALTAFGVAGQWFLLHRHIAAPPLFPSIDRSALASLASFGGMSWLQAVSGVIFSQADRLLLGTVLGAAPMAYYGVCVQLAQPVHGLTSAGLHFLFPHLTGRAAHGWNPDLRRPVLRALLLNLTVDVSLSTALLVFGHRILSTWMGADFARRSDAIFPFAVISFTMLAANVTGHYTMLALGRIRLVTALNVAGGLLMLLVMALLVPRRGIEGAAFARLIYGPVTCLVYLPLLRLFQHDITPRVETAIDIATEKA